MFRYRWIYCETTKNRPYVPESLRKVVRQISLLITSQDLRNTTIYFVQIFLAKFEQILGQNHAVLVKKIKFYGIQNHCKVNFKFRMLYIRFDHIQLDFVGPFSLSDRFSYILTTVARFFHWPETYPMRYISTRTVAKTFLSQ